MFEAIIYTPMKQADGFMALSKTAFAVAETKEKVRELIAPEWDKRSLFYMSMGCDISDTEITSKSYCDDNSIIVKARLVITESDTEVLVSDLGTTVKRGMLMASIANSKFPVVCDHMYISSIINGVVIADYDLSNPFNMSIRNDDGTINMVRVISAMIHTDMQLDSMARQKVFESEVIK